MEYYGIKTPNTEHRESYIWWIGNSQDESWKLFFQFPDKNGNLNSYRAPLGEAKKAYEAIGYRCVKLEVKIKEHVFF